MREASCLLGLHRVGAVVYLPELGRGLLLLLSLLDELRLLRLLLLLLVQLSRQEIVKQGVGGGVSTQERTRGPSREFDGDRKSVV